MLIWLTGHAEPREFSLREVVELIASRGLLKDTLIFDEASKKWLQAGDHPLTGCYFESVGPEPFPLAEPSSGEGAKGWWPVALAWLVCAITIAGGTGLLILLHESFSWVLRFLAIGILAGPVLVIGLQFARGRRPGWGIGRSMYAGAIVTSALLVIFLAIQVPAVRNDSTKRSYERALAAMSRSLELGIVPKKFYGTMVYGRYAPFLNLLQTMAYDYQKEVNDYHGQMAALFGEHSIGPNMLDSAEKLAGLRIALGDAEALDERHREEILLKLDAYKLSVNTLPYSPETRQKLSATYGRLQSDVSTMIERYFDGSALTLKAMDQWLSFYVNNPKAYVVSHQDFFPVESHGPGGIRIVETMMRISVQYTNPVFADEARAFAEQARASLAKNIIIQNDMNRYYSGSGRETIIEMERIIGDTTD